MRAPSWTAPGEMSLLINPEGAMLWLRLLKIETECLSHLDFSQAVVNQVHSIWDVTLEHLGIIIQIKWCLFLLRFCRFPADDPQKVKMTRILEELINLTVKEKGVGSVPW